MGMCPSRQRSPDQPAVVVTVQTQSGGPPPPQAPEPPPPPAPTGPADAGQVVPQTPAMARRLALTEFWQHPVITTPKGKKLHIQGFCHQGQNAPANTAWTWCERCTRHYQTIDASNQGMPLVLPR